MTEVTMVRIYLSEQDSQLESLLKRLHDWEKVRGVSVFRAVSGYGDGGESGTIRLVDLSFDLPVVVEFFDAPAKVERILEHLATSIKPHHMVKWTAWMNEPEVQ